MREVFNYLLDTLPNWVIAAIGFFLVAHHLLGHMATRSLP